MDLKFPIEQENLLINGVDSSQKSSKITHSTTVQTSNVNHKFYIINFNFEFDALIGIDFLEKYEAKIDLVSKKLSLKYKEFPLFQHGQSDDPFYQTNAIIPARTIQLIKIPIQNIENIEEGICTELNFSNNEIKIPNCLVKVIDKQIITTIANFSTEDKSIKINPIMIEPIPISHQIIKSINNVQANNYCVKNFKDREKEILNQLRLTHLNDEEKSNIINLCLKYQNIFFLDGDQLTFTNEIKHEIKTKTDTPIFSKTYRYPYIHKEEVKRQISEMLNQNIIQPSCSPWSSPVWVVPKKLDSSGTQKWRVVIDYRKLNDITIGDRYPLPNIESLLDQLGKCQYFTTLDLASGFNQIEVEKKMFLKLHFRSKMAILNI